MNGAQSLVDLQSLIQKVEELRSSLLIEVHHLGGSKASPDSSDEDGSTGDHSSSDDEEHDEILERDS